MLPRGADLVGIAESLYRFELSDADWLRHVGTQLAPVVDPDHLGTMASNFRSPDPSTFAPKLLLELGVSAAHWEAFVEGTVRLPEEYIAEGIYNRSWSFMADVPGWDAISGVRAGLTRSLGIEDLLTLGALDARGRGCRFGAFQRKRRSIGPDLRACLGAMARHLAAVNGIRGTIEDGITLERQAAGVLDPDGRLVHATGDLRSEADAAELRRAAKDMDRARTKRGREDPYPALESWRACIGGRWTLVESFERDGRRFLLALQEPSSAKPPPGAQQLSERERQVVALARQGLTNKAIAYELGLAASTVRVLMSRAMAKAGARSREELVRKAGADGLP